MKDSNPPPSEELKIPFLPNLMTAGNLCCGFLAVLWIHYGIGAVGTSKDAVSFLLAKRHYEIAILFIFGSCIFDLLDGRMARLTGQDSPFGREFDSLADIISFGMAPAMLLAKAVLFELPNNVGWGIAMLYLLCGAMRLARFNCLAVMPKKPNDHGDFIGIPIPMAAGFIASLTMLLIHYYQNDKDLGMWKYALAATMLILSFLMMSKIRYPSFKKIDARARSSIWTLMAAAVTIMLIATYHYHAPVVLFSAYLIYGFVRPWISQRWQRDIEWEDEEEDSAPPNSVP